MIGNFIILLLALFEHTIFSYMVDTFGVLSNFKDKFDKMDALSDDYYQEMNFKFLITEYERAKFEK